MAAEAGAATEAAGQPPAGTEGGVALAVTGLSGNMLVDLVVQDSETILDVKKRIFAGRPTAPPRWQRLVFGGRPAHDTETIGSLAGGGAVTLQMLSVVDAGDLLDDLEIAQSACQALGNMTAAAVAPHLASLFENAAGQRLSPAAAASVLNKLRLKLPHHQDTAVLRGALLPHAMELLAAGVPESSRLVPILEWLGDGAIPHLVGWLGLLDRPVPCHLQGTVEQLRKHDSARVRLAARAALDSRAAACSAARVEELASLRAGLRRSAASADSAEDRSALEDLQAAFGARLREMAEGAANPKVRYAARRALRR